MLFIVTNSNVNTRNEKCCCCQTIFNTITTLESPLTDIKAVKDPISSCKTTFSKLSSKVTAVVTLLVLEL